MNSFIIRRLMPLFVFNVIVEIITASVTIVHSYESFDFSFLEMSKTFSILFLTSCISFIYMMIPYVLYLLFLPQSKQNSRVDKIITTFIYLIFIIAVLFEGVSAYIFWEEFSSAFNFIAVDYLVYTNEVIDNIMQSYPVFWLLGIIGVIALLIVLTTKKYLFTQIKSPKFEKRIFNTALYVLICALIYKNIDITTLEISKNRFNNEIGKDSTYSLFSAFLKNELPYDDFYITQDETKNIEVLQSKLKDNNSIFLNNHNISRNIGNNKTEIKANVVIVLMESMSAKFLDENRTEGQKLITPNLSKLSKEGLYFPNVYANGTRSVRGIEALTLAVPPLPGMSIVRRDNNEKLHSLGSIFRDKGYDNKWVYGGYGYFDNMNYFFENNNFQIVDRRTWTKEETTFANAWGACDEDSFNKIIVEADKSYNEGKPFLTFILTISNHRPFTYPTGKIDLEPKISKRDGGVKYADYAIGRFIEAAKTKDWFDNTVFVFVADHTAGAAGDEEINLEDHHIPMIIYAPKLVKPQRIDAKISQIDALPTLLNLLNFNYESRFYGQDALSADYESRFFVSNYQKIGYVKNDMTLILKPVKQYSFLPITADEKMMSEHIKEAVAFYQQASDWVKNLKE